MENNHPSERVILNSQLNMIIQKTTKQLLFLSITLFSCISAYGQSKPVSSDTTQTFTGVFYGLGTQAALAAKDRVGNTGSMNSDYYDYNTGLQLQMPFNKGRLLFSGNEQFTGSRTPSGFYVGAESTAHILSGADAQAITQYLSSRYGNSFDAGTAGSFSEKKRTNDFYNSLRWQINKNQKLTIFNHSIFSDNRQLQRDGQGFRFSSMAFNDVSKSIKTGFDWQGQFGDAWLLEASVAYTNKRNRRDPLSNPNMPQVQIAGRTPGTLIFLGSDREATIYKNTQDIWSISGQATLSTGIHEIILGTENNLHSIDFGYMSGWNGRIDYLSIEDFLNNEPYRVRGSYNYGNNSREYLLGNPAAQFQMNDFNLHVEDNIQLSDRLSVTPALYARYVYLPDMPLKSKKLENVWADPNFGFTYTYTPLNRIENKFLNKIDLMPRLNFSYMISENKDLLLEGGVGMYSGEIPISWLAYIYRHNGDVYGDYSQRADQEPFDPDLNPLQPTSNGISDYISQNGVIIENPNSGTTELDLADNDLRMPMFAKLNLALTYKVDGWEFGLDGFVEKTIRDFLWQQVNIKDDPHWYAYDTEHKQPVYSGSVDPQFSSIYLLSNTNKGYRYSAKGYVGKTFTNGLFFKATYAYGEAKDLMAGYVSSMEANRQLTPSLTPNNPDLAYSNTDTRHHITADAGYIRNWGKAGKTNISFSLDAQSGKPFSYGIVNYTLQGSSQYVSLVYIPYPEEAVNYFKDRDGITAIEQANAFNTFIDSDDYLKNRRGKFTERNAARTPWNMKVDMHLSHTIATNRDKTRSLSFIADIINLTNLLNKNWGKQYFASSVFNATASVGLTPATPFSELNEGPYPVFTFNEPATPYSIDYTASRTRFQLGLRYEF